MSESNQCQCNHADCLISPTTNGTHKCRIFSSPLPARQRPRHYPDILNASSRLLDEKVLSLIFEAVNWNPVLLSLCSCVCKKINAIAKRALWKQFCLSRAPRMVSDLLAGSKIGRIDGGWHALGKLLIFCVGCNSTENFEIRMVPGHIVPKSRLSKTAGKSFLIRQCETDVVYVTDPCEHEGDTLDIGLFRGVFRNFGLSKTWKFLIDRNVQLQVKELCSFCRARVWSMANAKLIPRSACTRLAAFEQNVEYFICLNGHLSGKCLLLRLSDSEDDSSDEFGES